MQETIFLITVFDKCEPDPRWGYNLGDSYTKKVFGI